MVAVNEAASLDDLRASTDVGRSSLYAAYGGKQALYLSTRERYEAAAIGRIDAARVSCASPREGIAAFIERIIEDIVAGPGNSTKRGHRRARSLFDVGHSGLAAGWQGKPRAHTVAKYREGDIALPGPLRAVYFTLKL